MQETRTIILTKSQLSVLKNICDVYIRAGANESKKNEFRSIRLKVIDALQTIA